MTNRTRKERGGKKKKKQNPHREAQQLYVPKAQMLARSHKAGSVVS
jgi:hypothetical protein